MRSLRSVKMFVCNLNMNGFVFIDKPRGLTSFDLVREVRNLSGEKKVGHSGTLDPLATGLMLLALGEGTKLLEYLIGHGKEYEVLAHFGHESDTYDAEGKISEVDKDIVVSEDAILAIISEKFLGKIKQVPPKYSALKIDGKKAYELAREGKKVEMKERDVDIHEFELLEYNWPRLKFRISCGSGTYIRSLVHDLGIEFKCGAYVEELRRTKIDEFLLKESCELDELSKNFEQRVVSLEDVARKFSVFELSDADFDGLKDGRVLLGKKIEQAQPVMAFYKDELVGILNEIDGGGIKYKKMIFS